MSDFSLNHCLDESRHAITLFDVQWHILYKNAPFDLLFPTTIMTKTLFEMLQHNPLVLERIRKVTRQEGSHSLWDFPVETATQAIKTMDIECYPVVSQLTPEPLHCLILYDRSGSAQADEHQKRLDRLQYLATISSGLAHEIRNPLSGIKGASQLLTDSLKDNDELKEYAEIILNEVVRVDRLLKDLQHLTQPQRLKRSTVNINKVAHAIFLLQKTVEPKRITYIEEYDPSLPEISADHESLSQVVLNLVKNARQAIKGEGKITLRTRAANDFLLHKSGRKQQYMAIEVIDTGEGIQTEAKQNIFIPFFTTKASGSGLGLALCQQIVEEHGGQMLVKSEEGKGSTFSVLLPI